MTAKVAACPTNRQDQIIERIETGIAPSSAPISDAVRAGKHLWLVDIAEDPATGDIVEGGIEVQARRCIQNLEIALKAAGGTLLSEPEDRPWGARMFQFTDLDGFKLGASTPLAG